MPTFSNGISYHIMLGEAVFSQARAADTVHYYCQDLLGLGRNNPTADDLEFLTCPLESVTTIR